MLARMSSKELRDWWVFYYVEPFGAAVNSLGHATTAAAILNTSPHLKPDSELTKVEDMMPSFEEIKPQSVDEMLQIAQALTVAMGGEDRRELE